MATKKTISNSFVVNTVEDGKDGERGKVGRFFYYAGDFDANNADKEFLVNDAQAPFFRHKNEGTAIYYYYVFNPEVNGEYTMSKMWEESVSSFNNKPWEIMTNDFKYLITEALFSENAHLGSAIINGDWMISQHGKIGEDDSTDFTKFNEENPNNNNGTDFIPNYAVNLKTGVSYQNEAYLTGSLFANSIQTNFVDIPAHVHNDDRIPEDYYLGMDEETGAVKPLGVWNFRVVHPHNQTNPSSKTIILPVNQYAYYGQRVIIYNPPPYYDDFSTKVIGGDVTIRPAILDDFNQDTKDWDTVNSNYVFLSGLSKAAKSDDIHNPVLYTGYTPVSSLTFGNGVVELMCVPSINGEDGCDWCVVNLGTNYYYMD